MRNLVSPDLYVSFHLSFFFFFISYFLSNLKCNKTSLGDTELEGLKMSEYYCLLLKVKQENSIMSFLGVPHLWRAGWYVHSSLAFETVTFPHKFLNSGYFSSLDAVLLSWRSSLSMHALQLSFFWNPPSRYSSSHSLLIFATPTTVFRYYRFFWRCVTLVYLSEQKTQPALLRGIIKQLCKSLTRRQMIDKASQTHQRWVTRFLIL